MLDGPEVLRVIERVDTVCVGARRWLEERQGRDVETFYVDTPGIWLLWLYAHAGYGDREHTDRALRVLTACWHTSLSASLQEALRTRDFDDTRWTTADEWKKIVMREPGLRPDGSLIRVLLRLHEKVRSNYWILYDALLPTISYTPTLDQSTRFSQAFCAEYPHAELLERLRHAPSRLQR